MDLLEASKALEITYLTASGVRALQYLKNKNSVFSKLSTFLNLIGGEQHLRTEQHQTIPLRRCRIQAGSLPFLPSQERRHRDVLREHRPANGPPLRKRRGLAQGRRQQPGSEFGKQLE